MDWIEEGIHQVETSGHGRTGHDGAGGRAGPAENDGSFGVGFGAGNGFFEGVTPMRWRLLMGASAALAWLAAGEVRAETDPAYWQWAQRPPMGWNSWDCFGTTVTEAQAKAEADYMAKNLKSHGWEYVVVDIQWFEAGNKVGRMTQQSYPANDFLKPAELRRYRGAAVYSMDGYGRFLPAPNRFPSAANGAGFKPLADYIHSLGLKFGIHFLRGIPRLAVAQNTTILGTNYHAADIADENNTCPWNPDMYGVDMTKPGAQAYYNSLYDMFASWGVDFVKVDDISARTYQEPEIEAIRRAIDQTGRPMVLSLSPGATPLAAGEKVERSANMWRVSDDFWDRWQSLYEQFQRLHDWTPYRGPGHFPDGDMLPLGIIAAQKPTKFTQDEQYTLMTLWCIARSPLIHGGDMTKMDDFTLSLLTNDEVLAVDQNSMGNKELFNQDGLIAWVADVPGTADKYVAVFNARDKSPLPPNAYATPASGEVVPVNLASLGFTGPVNVRDLWRHYDIGQRDGAFNPSVPWHGAQLYRLSPVKVAAKAVIPGRRSG